MADETLGLEIKYTLDATDVIAGSEAVNQALQETGSAMEKTGSTFKEGAEDIEQAVDEMADEIKEKAREAGDALEETGRQAKKTGQETGEGASKGIKGLDELKDSAGETSSSLGAMGGAISVVNPQLGAMVSNAGALSGGLEGAAKMGGGFKAAMSALSSPIGLVATGLIAGGLALFAWSKRSKGAKIDTEALEGAIEALEAAQKSFMASEIELSVLRGETTQLRAELEHLGTTIQHEFADKMKAANAPFKEFTDGIESSQDRIKELTDEIDELSQANMSSGKNARKNREALNSAVRARSNLIGKLNEQRDAYEREIAGSSDAARVRRELIAGIEDEEARRRAILEIRIKADDEARRSSDLLKAQADNDVESIRRVSFEIAVQGDALLTSKLTWARWAESTAESLKAHEGFAAPLLRKMADLLTQRSEAIREEIESETEFSTIFQRNLRGMQSRIKATDEATAAEANLASMQERAADMLAQARGELAIINKQYADSIAEITELTEENAITEMEAAELVAAANREKEAATKAYIDSRHEEIQAQHDMHAQAVALRTTERQDIESHYDNLLADAFIAHQEGFADDEEWAAKKEELTKDRNRKIRAINLQAFQSDLLDMKAATDQMTAFMDAVIANKTQKLDQEEEAALARAEGNMDQQARIRKKFEKKRRDELTAAFNARKGLEISNAIISGASAAIAALAPPPVGAGPILGPFLAGGIAATTIAQIATISQEQPSFHQGGIVGGDGDQMINAQGGEVVLNRNAVADLGGASAANSLNSGGVAGGTVVVQMTYRNRMFDQLVVDNLAKGGPLKKALGRATRRGRRGRIGGRL